MTFTSQLAPAFARRLVPRTRIPRGTAVLAALTMLAGGLLLTARPSAADGPRDNDPEQVRRVPRLGIELSVEQQQALGEQLDALERTLEPLRKNKDVWVQATLPDVEIFHRAVHVALKHREFFAPGDIDAAFRLLEIGRQRAADLGQHKAPWLESTGLTVLGYRSKIDHSVQPYGLVIPDSYLPQGERPHRLDLWFHGRGETLSEVKFVDQRLKQAGQYTPPGAFVLHPYGRYSNAFKFAGEVDVLEALEDAQRRFRIDSRRIAVRGFSMGGAACWQFAVHYADRWFAANPGAGFSETPEFLKFFQKETLQPAWYEEKLWNLYDCNRYAANLWHCPTVAYSGELDIQKQAADVMVDALRKESIDLVHLIGPGTGHSIHPQSKIEIEQRLASLAERGKQQFPRRVQLVTYTLKYPRMHWVTIERLQKHWEASRVEAELQGENQIRVTTRNVTQLTLSMRPGWCPFDLREAVKLTIDGQAIVGPQPKSDRSWNLTLHRAGERWAAGPANVAGLVKRSGLQGPIDDAFMDSFIFVRPTGACSNDLVGRWTEAELEHAIEHWRRQFRGDARVKADRDVTEADIRDANLVLFGDPQSNALIRKVLPNLPISWDEQTLKAGGESYPAATHAPVLIYPNPLNPNRYVVLNSGFTYREFAYLNNARQVPKLPDWAVIDLRVPPNARWPGRVVDANFFDEQWQLAQ